MPKTLFIDKLNNVLKKVDKFIDENFETNKLPDTFGEGLLGDRARAARRKRQKVIDSRKMKHKGDK